MDDHIRAGVPPRYVIKTTRSTQSCIPPGSLSRVPALIGWGKGGMSPLPGGRCDLILHASFRSSEACCKLLYPVTLLYSTLTAKWH